MTILYEQWEQQANHLVSLLGEGTSVVSNAEELVAAVNSGRDESLVLLGPSTPLAEAVAFAEQCRLRRPALGVILLRQHLDVSVMAEALRAGVREVVDSGDHAGILAACVRSRELSRQIGSGGRAGKSTNSTLVTTMLGETKDGQVITVFAAKGGVGKSTIATNLAVSLAEGGRRKVCLIDLDLAFGDVAILLQLSPDRTIADAIPVADRIDETGMRTLLTPYKPGLDVLLAPVQPALAEDVSRDLVSELIQLAKENFDFVVVDTASVFSEQTLAALDATHCYVLVATPELPALKNLRVTLDMFDLLGYRREERIVVLNRADSKVGLSSADVERVIRMPLTGWVPSSRDVPVSVNSGVPLSVSHPNHPVSAAVRDLAVKRFLTAPGDVKAKRGLFSKGK